MKRQVTRQHCNITTIVQDFFNFLLPIFFFFNIYPLAVTDEEKDGDVGSLDGGLTLKVVNDLPKTSDAAK